MNCDKFARWYALAEHLAFWRALERRRNCFLVNVHDVRQVLVLGDGDGRALVELLRACPDAQVEYIDLSVRMLEIAQRRVGATDRVQWAVANALNTSYPAAHYDLIVTHFFLDCLDAAQVNTLVERLVKAMQPGGRWLVSEFRAEAAWSKAVVRLLYLFFRMMTGLGVTRLPEYRTILGKNGFVLVKRQTALHGLLASELWTLP